MVNIYTMNKVVFLRSVVAVATQTDTSVMRWGFFLLLLLFLRVSFGVAGVFVTEVGSPVSWFQHEWLLDVL